MKSNYRLRKSESGQILILGGLLSLVIMVFGYMLLNIGRVTEDKIKLQNTADTAAFAAAESQANTISSLGWLNQAMGTIYYYMASHAANVTVESTKMSFVHHSYNGSAARTYDTLKANALGSNSANSILVDGLVIGEEDEIVSSYDKAYLDAYTMIPRGEIWLWQMAKLQRGMAYIAPLMAEKEVYLAIKDRAARASIFPKFKMYVDPASNFDLEIHKIYETNSKTGWDMAGHPGGLSLFAERDEDDFGPYDAVPSVDDPDIWKLYLRYKLQATGPENEMEIESLGKLPPENEISVYRIRGSFPGWETWRTVMYNPDGTTIINGNGDTITITNNPDGSTTIQGGATNITYRRNGNTFEVLNGGGGWDSMGEVNANIDGVDVRVTTNFSVSLGDITIVDPNHYVIGNTTIHVNKNDIDISTQIGRASVRTEKGTVFINGLSTANADGKWHRIWDGHWTDSLRDQGGDTIRHRMLVIHSDTDWKYELREIGSYTQEENDEAHQGDGRFSITNGATFALGRQGATKDDVDWLGYPSEQQKELNDDKFSSKWYDLSKIHSGKPLEYVETINGDEKTIEAFHLVEQCWNPECVAAGRKGFYPVEYTCINVATGVPANSPGGVVRFTELEMCRICYDNHRLLNSDKRKVKFLMNPAPPLPPLPPGTNEFPYPNGIVVNGRIVIWTDYNSSFGSLGTYLTNSYSWERKSPFGTINVTNTELSKRPAAVTSQVTKNLDFMPKYMVDALGGSTANTLTYAAIQGMVSRATLPWDMDHDLNGEADVIMYPSDARPVNRNVASWFYYQNDETLTMPSDEFLKSMQTLGLSCPKPMVLSEDFFKYGINVAVTSDKYTEVPKKRFLGLENQDNGKSNTSILTSISPASWGMVAIASARTAFWLESNGSGSYIFSPGDIDWSKDARYAQAYQTFKNNTGLGMDGSTNFAYDNSINFEEHNEYRMRRQFFVRRHHENLYTSDWVAKLVPIKYAVRKDDIGLSESDNFDSSARYIYFNLMRTEWRESYIKTSGWKPPENMTLGPKGPSLSTSNVDIEAIFTH